MQAKNGPPRDELTLRQHDTYHALHQSYPDPVPQKNNFFPFARTLNRQILHVSYRVRALDSPMLYKEYITHYKTSHRIFCSRVLISVALL